MSAATARKTASLTLLDFRRSTGFVARHPEPGFARRPQAGADAMSAATAQKTASLTLLDFRRSTGFVARHPEPGFARRP
jgi:hypothetical protein